jgi:hypothetical protein
MNDGEVEQVAVPACGGVVPAGVLGGGVVWRQQQIWRRQRPWLQQQQHSRQQRWKASFGIRIHTRDSRQGEACSD